MMATIMTTGTMKWGQVKSTIRRPYVTRDSAIAQLSQSFITMLLAVDFLMMFLHLVYWYTDVTESDYLSLSRERGYAEFFQYIKFFWLALLFAAHGVRRGGMSYLFWAATFGYLLLDDAFTIHERSGVIIRRTFDIPAQLGLRGEDFGELIFYALVLGMLLLLLGIVYYFGTPAFRRDSHYLLGLLAGFGFFAAVGDVLHMLVRETPYFRVFDVIEDGGEMVMISLILWFTFLLPLRDRRERSA